MPDRDDNFIPEEDENSETPQETKKLKVHEHCTIVKNEATGTKKN